MVNQDYTEIPWNSTQTGKNSQQKCLQVNKSVSMTSHSMGMCMSSIFVTEMFADEEY